MTKVDGMCMNCVRSDRTCDMHKIERGTDEDEHRLPSAIRDRDRAWAHAEDTAVMLKSLIKSHRKVCIALAKFAGNPEPTVTVQIMEMAGDVDKEVEPHELKTFKFDTEAEADAFEQGIRFHNHMVV